MEKFISNYVGQKLYLSQRTGNYYVDQVKIPYTVIGLSNNEIIIQEAMPLFYGPRYFDTLADEIVEDKNGRIRTLKLSRAKKYKDQWVSKSYSGDTYPYVAHFGKWEYYPYVN